MDAANMNMWATSNWTLATPASAVYEAIPVGETRLALVRAFLNGRLELGANGMLARGYTGQTTERFDPGWHMGATPYCAPGSGPSGLPDDFDCGTNRAGAWAYDGVVAGRFDIMALWRREVGARPDLLKIFNSPAR